MSASKNHITQKIIIIAFIILPLSSYASKKCPDAFNPNNSSVSQTQINSLELDSLNKGKSILITVNLFLNVLSRNIQYSKNNDKELDQTQKAQKLQDIEQAKTLFKETIENIDNQAIAIKEIISQSNSPQTEFRLLVPLITIQSILLEKVQKHITPVSKQTQMTLKSKNVDETDRDLLLHIQKNLEDDQIDLYKLINKIDNKIKLLMRKNNLSESHDAKQIHSTGKQRTKNILENITPLLDGIRHSANLLTENITSIPADSKNFDTFTRDSVQIILLQQMKTNFQNHKEKIEKLLNETNKVIEDIQSILSSHSNSKPLAQSFKLESIKSHRNYLKEFLIDTRNTITLFEQSIEVVSTELQNPNYKGREIDKRVNLTQIQTSIEGSFLNIVDGKLYDMSFIEVQNAIARASISVNSL